MKAIYGLAPLAHTLGLVISQMSYNDKLYFCLTADRDSVPDPAALVECLNRAFDQYQALLTRPRHKPRNKRAPRAKAKIAHTK